MLRYGASTTLADHSRPGPSDPASGGSTDQDPPYVRANLATALSIWATGKYYVYEETSDYIVRSLLSSIAGASLAIGLIMAVMLRSIRLGIVSMILANFALVADLLLTPALLLPWRAKTGSPQPVQPAV